ncbi:FliM/FliN family flagellar motor switch protein [Pseudaestuariivita rosea]|uniref:FliM/FliN family flagellar motor switch protein n=1 Tax=Pseudaestuariivita rosea TaxID=2763263 RepID=UPI001ABAAB24|nr:FliM/FliN family flagellar motor switch protein [Pseudaestuariivita rosea]
MVEFIPNNKVIRARPRPVEINDLDLHNRLCTLDCIELGRLNGKRVSLSVDMHASDQIDLFLQLQIGDINAVLGLPGELIDKIANDRPEQIETSDLCFLTNLILDDVLAPLEERLGLPITFTAVCQPAPATASFTIKYGTDLYAASLSGTDAATMLLTQYPAPKTDTGHVPMTASLRIGHVNLPVSTVSDLGRGDVIIPNDQPITADRGTFHLYPNLMADVTFDHHTITLQEDLKMALDTTTAQVSLHNIDIDLTFELCRQTVPLHKIETLGKGHVFRFDSRIDDSFVRILANGRLIATGELVQIGDRIGVQLRDRVDD